MLLPKVNPTVGEITGEYTATGTAAETLEKLTVDDNPSKAGYDRDAFGFEKPTTTAMVTTYARMCSPAI